MTTFYTYLEPTPKKEHPEILALGIMASPFILASALFSQGYKAGKATRKGAGMLLGSVIYGLGFVGRGVKNSAKAYDRRIRTRGTSIGSTTRAAVAMAAEDTGMRPRSSFGNFQPTVRRSLEKPSNQSALGPTTSQPSAGGMS